MQFKNTSIDYVILINPQVFGDERGFFMETWHQDKFKEAGINVNFVQDNHSKSSRGILRGLHYQLKNTQGKLVRVIQGEIFDVAVDVRRSSPTFGQWVGEYLSAENKKMLWIPEGFAHGLYVTSESAEVIYKCSDFYTPEHERSIVWNDPDIAIDWPLVNDQPPLLSNKDKNGASLKDAEVFP